VFLAESFIDPARFTGVCYRAANWRVLGTTRGYAKHQQTYTAHHHPKWVLIYPLHRQAQQRLADPHDTHGRLPTMKPQTLTPKQLASLHEQIGHIPDCRRRRGIRHQYRPVLTLALAAVLCGARSFTALGEFAASLTQAQLKHLGCRFDRRRQRLQPPSESTLRRVLQASDAEALDRVLGQWLLAQTPTPEAIAVDGKTLRGARRPDGSQVHLLTAFLHQHGSTIAQVEVGAKTNEIPELKRLLDPLELHGRVVTADALHTQHTTARYLVEEKQAAYVLMLKDNQPTLRDAVAALEPDDFSPAHTAVDKGPWSAGDPDHPGLHRAQPLSGVSACPASLPPDS